MTSGSSLQWLKLKQWTITSWFTDAGPFYSNGKAGLGSWSKENWEWTGQEPLIKWGKKLKYLSFEKTTATHSLQFTLLPLSAGEKIPLQNLINSSCASDTIRNQTNCVKLNFSILCHTTWVSDRWPWCHSLPRGMGSLRNVAAFLTT